MRIEGRIKNVKKKTNYWSTRNTNSKTVSMRDIIDRLQLKLHVRNNHAFCTANFTNSLKMKPNNTIRMTTYNDQYSITCTCTLQTGAIIWFFVSSKSPRLIFLLRRRWQTMRTRWRVTGNCRKVHEDKRGVYCIRSLRRTYPPPSYPSIKVVGEV